MYGKEKTISGANRRYAKDAGGSQGSTEGQSKDDPNQNKGGDVSATNAQEGKDKAEELVKRAGLKAKGFQTSHLTHTCRDARKGEDQS